MMRLLIRTCQDKSEDSKETVAEPNHDTCKDDMTDIRRDIVCGNRLFLCSSGKHRLLKTTEH